MRSVFARMYVEIRGLHQSAYILAFFAFISQLLALVRDRLFAHYFGAGSELDIYYAAFKIPDLLFVLFASILSVYVLIPFISKAQEEGGDTQAQKMLSMVFSCFLIFYAVVASIVFVFAHTLADLLFTGFDTAQHETFVLLTRILLLQPLILGISSLYGVVTQIGERFLLYAISPLLYNGGIIFGVVLLYPIMGMPGLVYGVVLGALLHLLIQLPYVRSTPLIPQFLRTIDTRVVGDIVRASLPRALTLSLQHITFIAFVGMASGMAVGSVTVLQFAYNLQSVPLAIIGVSYSVAAFPILARLFANGATDAFRERVETVLRHILFWTIPIIALAVVVRAQFVRVVLGTGAFDWDDTRLTAATFALFIISLPAQAIHLLIVRAFYAGGNTRIPFLVTLGSTVLTLILSLGLFVYFELSSSFATTIKNLLRLSDVSGTEVIMLPLGYTLVQWFHSLLLIVLFVRAYNMGYRSLVAVSLRAIAASLVGGVVAYVALQGFVSVFESDTLIAIFLQGLCAGLLGLCAIVLTLFVLKSPELKELWQTCKERVRGRKSYAPDEVDTLAH